MSRVAAVTADIHRELAAARAELAARSDDIVAMQEAIASIRSPTFGEAARGAWVADQLERAGWSVHNDDAGNVIARAVASDAPAIAVCSHLDTVYSSDVAPVPAREGTRLTAPGICDNSRGLAALIAIGRVLDTRRAATRGPAGEDVPIELVATTAEEGRGDLRGAKHYVATRTPVAFIALDGAGDERVVNTALGSRRFRVEYAGPGGHSWSAFGLANPVHAAARCASTVANLPLPAGTALTVSRIGGGVSVNAIPQDAWLEVDLRGTSETDLAALEEKVVAAAVAAAREENARRAGGDALLHRIERIGFRAGGRTDERAPLVAAATAATALVGRRPALAIASTDANAAVAAGIPAIAIGAGGRGGNTHSDREWFDPTDASVGVERALTIVATVARLGAKS